MKAPDNVKGNEPTRGPRARHHPLHPPSEQEFLLLPLQLSRAASGRCHNLSVSVSWSAGWGCCWWGLVPRVLKEFNELTQVEHLLQGWHMQVLVSTSH